MVKRPPIGLCGLAPMNQGASRSPPDRDGNSERVEGGQPEQDRYIKQVTIRAMTPPRWRSSIRTCSSSRRAQGAEDPNLFLTGGKVTLALTP